MYIVNYSPFMVNYDLFFLYNFMLAYKNPQFSRKKYNVGTKMQKHDSLRKHTLISDLLKISCNITYWLISNNCIQIGDCS